MALYWREVFAVCHRRVCICEVYKKYIRHTTRTFAGGIPQHILFIKEPFVTCYWNVIQLKLFLVNISCDFFYQFIYILVDIVIIIIGKYWIHIRLIVENIFFSFTQYTPRSIALLDIFIFCNFWFVLLTAVFLCAIDCAYLIWLSTFFTIFRGAFKCV